MLTAKEIVERNVGNPTGRYAIRTFSGGNRELETFLNHLPPGWRLIDAKIATGALGSAAGLFEISEPDSSKEVRNGQK